MNDVSDQLATLEAAVAYVRAGRKYEALSLDALTSRYITAVEVAVAVQTMEAVQFIDDLGAEFELRGMEAPNWVLAGHTSALPSCEGELRTTRWAGWVPGDKSAASQIIRETSSRVLFIGVSWCFPVSHRALLLDCQKFRCNRFNTRRYNCSAAFKHESGLGSSSDARDNRPAMPPARSMKDQ